MDYPLFTQKHKSLMARYLTKKVFEKYKNTKTENGVSLADVINSGLENPDSGVGVYAGDSQSYEVFEDLFNPIIQEYHHFSKEDVHTSNLDLQDLHVEALDEDFVLSTRIRVGRNLEDFPLGPAVSKKQRLQTQEKVLQALNSLSCKGVYYPLEGMSKEDKDRLIKEHFLFKSGDRFLEAAGLNRDWPSGRGIYHNEEKTFLVWVNEEDQLRIISMQKGGDIKAVFSRLVSYIKELETKMKFSFSSRLGYITSCPTNLGTAMRASVHVKLPKLGKEMTKFKQICDAYYLQIRGIDGEHSKSHSGIYDISNKRRLGISEIQCVQDMHDGVKALIEYEKKKMQF